MDAMTQHRKQARGLDRVLSASRWLLLAACTPALFLNATNVRAEDCLQCAANKKLALAYIDRMAQKDLDGALDLAAGDARFWLSGPGNMDKQGFRNFLTPFNRMILSLKFDVVSVTAEDDRVAVEAMSAAELRNGKMYRNQYVFMFTSRNGKLSAVREYSDSAPALAAFKSE